MSFFKVVILWYSKNQMTILPVFTKLYKETIRRWRFVAEAMKRKRPLAVCLVRRSFNVGGRLPFKSALALLLLSFQSCQEKISNTDRLFSLVPTSITGIKFQNSLTENYQYNHMVNEMFITGAGVAVGDINNDGLPDLFFTGNQVQDRLYLNIGGLRFKDVTEEAGILQETIWSSGVTFGDVNNDGYLDIYVCKFDYQQGKFGKNLLYINNGPASLRQLAGGPRGVTFSEQASAYSLDSEGFSIQASFFDFNKDGLMDLYLVNQPPSSGYSIGHQIPKSELTGFKSLSSELFRNMGDTDGSGQVTFQNVTDTSGISYVAKGLSASVGDFNNDTWPDVYVANDYEKPDRYYVNQGNGRFENQIDQAIKHMSNYSMGSDVADFDNDGFLDIMIADMVAEDHFRIKTNMGGMDPQAFRDNVDKGFHYQYMFNTLQRNNGNGTFSEIAHLAGVSNTDWSWSALFGDFDNDGWKDLWVTNGIRRAMRNSDYVRQRDKTLDSLQNVARASGKNFFELVDIMAIIRTAREEKMPNYIFKNNGDLTFTKKTREWGLHRPSLSNGAAYADLDLDGDLDLVINNIDEAAHIYRNNAIENQVGNFLRFRVTNDHGSPAYGARVKLYREGAFWQMQELVNARGYESKSEDVLHFGLGQVEEVSEVEITWQDGSKLVKQNVKANLLLRVQEGEANKQVHSEEKDGQAQRVLFREVTQDLNIDYVHQENEYDDYAKEILLPHKMSNFGPGLAVGDVNQDGLDDFYVGGASGYAGILFIQGSNSKFSRWQQKCWNNDKIHEDMGAEFFDADQDGDLDLYVVSGGNEFEARAKELQDRLYLNNGKGSFKVATNSLPKMYTSGSKVVPADYDRDGDIDLFVGGRLVPGKYPWPAKSYILRNDTPLPRQLAEGSRGGIKFTDITADIAPDLLEAGLVTSAVWTDFNGDGYIDLAVVGEWMAVTLLENRQGQFVNITIEAGLGNTTGWYYSIVSEDFDKDGDYDFVAGNLGLNYKYKASIEEPFEVYSSDFDDNGRLDIVLGYHEHGELFPLRGKECSTQQLPQLAGKFSSYESFGNANLRDVYGSGINEALNYKAKTFASSYIENLGDGTFKVSKLPNHAQVSSVNNILTQDFNGDGYLDLLISGNLYPVEIETPRNDAGIGLYLTGDGEGNFVPIHPAQSGFLAPFDAKDMKKITLGKGKNKSTAILVANNQDRLQVIKYGSELLN